MAIPFLPGVPPLKSTIQRTLISTGLVALRDYFVTPANQIWGIFDAKGNRVINADTFVSVDYRNNWRISDYPCEKDAFASYNKIATPYNSSVTLAQGGTQAQRTAFLNTLESIALGLSGLTIVTPEKSFFNAVIENYGYERRTQNGANMIIAVINFREVRITPAISYSQTRSGAQLSTTVPSNEQTQPNTSTGLADVSNVKTPSAAATVNNGSVSALEQAASAAAGNMMSVDYVQ